ncbi:hypothetical protein BDV96DRAFT_174834 [Lophiotrema nucula]|uniref:BTB domain-containing protein n=1 Tax=Lophiotrema nucula TaxID=690887 RepID=A0A6A5YWY9_9PLEO|nr:hypothetical protein BDV96DRAFT_174834 [Lophiotrema nucula]
MLPPRLDKRAPTDMFLAMLQGAPIVVKIGPTIDGISLQTYVLPKSLLACNSTFFRDEFKKATKDTVINSIDLPDVDPVQFGFFIYFLYRGGYHYSRDKEAATAGELILPSIKAYTMGDKLGAKSFMDQVMLHVYHDLGKLFSITPKLMEWTQVNSPPTSKLRELFVDALIMHWGKNNNVVRHGKETEEEWSILFDQHQDLRKEFIFGLKGDVRVKRYEEYCVGIGAERVLPAKVVRFKEETP